MTLRPLLPGLAALLGLSLAFAAPAGAEPDSTRTDGLGPTTLPPWNPPRAMSVSRPWETALQLPGRIATLPLSALGIVTRNTMLAAEANAVVPKLLVIFAAPRHLDLNIQPASLGDRTGFGGEVRYEPGYARGLVDAGLSGSTGRYSRFHGRLGTDLARFEYISEWRPHDKFFDLAPGSTEDDFSSYSNQIQIYGLTSRLSLVRPAPGKTPRHTLSLSAATRIMTVGEPQGDPDRNTFDAASSPFEDALNREWKGSVLGAALESDRRSGSPHWSHGFRVKAGFERYDPESQSGGVVPPAPPLFAVFQRYSLEAEGGLSFMRDPRTIRLLVRAVDTEVSDEKGSLIVPSDLVSLGGSEGLAGFEPGRFHGLDALVSRLSYIFPLAQHYEIDLHAEAGGVYSDLQNEPRLHDLHTSYGVLFRPRTNFAPIGALGVEWSRESVRFRFAVGGVE